MGLGCSPPSGTGLLWGAFVPRFPCTFGAAVTWGWRSRRRLSRCGPFGAAFGAAFGAPWRPIVSRGGLAHRCRATCQTWLKGYEPPRHKDTKFCRVLVSAANRTNSSIHHCPILEAQCLSERCGSLRPPAPCFPSWRQRSYGDDRMDFLLKKKEMGDSSTDDTLISISAPVF